MNERVDLKDIQQKAYTAMSNDGLDALLLGVSLALISLFLADRRFGLALIVGMAIQVWGVDALKRRFTYPRVGFVAFPEPRKSIKLKIGILLSVLLAVLLFVPLLYWLLPIYASAILGILTFVRARRTNTLIDYTGTVLFLLSCAVGLSLWSSGMDAGKATAFQLWGLAAILIPIGLFRLTSFLRKYPIRSEDVSDSEVSNAPDH